MKKDAIYESNISTAKWLIYDVPGNVGWILYIAQLVPLFMNRPGFMEIPLVQISLFAGFLPVLVMLVGIAELISERMQKLDRILPKNRLYRGFGALTWGGFGGVVIALNALFASLRAGCSSEACQPLMLLAVGGALCGLFAGLIFKTFRPQNRKEGELDKVSFRPEQDGFYGVYYPNPKASNKAMIIMLGDSSDDRMAVSGVKWAQKLGCNVMAMSPDKQDYGHHNYPLERFGKAIAYLKTQGNQKIGIAGASTTGMVALVAASYFPDITLTIAISPPDFIMEGFYQDGKDGAHERPGDNESSLSWGGEPLPYLPYAYRHPTYWQMIKKESKDGGDMIASRKMFDESERLHPIQEAEKIKVEHIKGRIIFVGAEDDVLWDTCKYIRRMEQRLAEKPHECEYEALLYEHGTHFTFPQSMLDIMMPPIGSLFVGAAFRAGRKFPKECKQTRLDIDEKLSDAIRSW